MQHVSNTGLVRVWAGSRHREAVMHHAPEAASMKYLLLLRHAKSDWGEPNLPDHDRPLNKRGRRDAPRVGNLLVSETIMPDLIITSSARRARETTAAVVEASQYTGRVEQTGRLYGAHSQDYIAVLRAAPDACARILLVSHNPGIETLASDLTKKSIEMPTASLVHIALPIEHWRDLNETGRGELLMVWRPKDGA
jgi:phosphohistidine phosphatase